MSRARLATPLAAGVIAAVLVSGIVGLHRTGRELPGFEGFERRLLDVRFQLRGPRPPGSEVVILAFDNRTLAEDPTLYERRDGWAQLIRATHAAGAKVIGIDALFTSDELILPAPLTTDINQYLRRAPARPPAAGSEPATAATPAAPPVGPEPAADQLLRRVQHETQGDEHLEQAIREAGSVILGFHLGVSHAGKLAPVSSLGRGKYGQSMRGPWTPRAAREVIASLPRFNQAAHALGIVTVLEDDSHSLRELPLVRTYADSFFAALAVQLIAAARDLPRGALAYVGTDRTVKLGGQSIALAGDDGILLNFRGPAGTFPTISVSDVVRGRLPPGALQGKIAIIGLTYLGHDFTRTSFGGGFPGVEMHATAVDNILRGDALRRVGFLGDSACCLALGLAIALLFWGRLALGPLTQVGIALALLAGFLVTAYELFAARNLWLSLMGPIVTASVVLATCLTVAYAAEGLQRRRVRHAFGRYLASEIIDELLENPAALALGGERRHLTVLFSDIRNFTSFSEKLAPEQLVKVLNTYLTPMTHAVLDHGGFLDKFIGDAVMAVFGAPVKNPGHPGQACACALRMHAEVERLRPILLELGVDLHIGVGLNSGEMVVGNMGAEEHFNYTVMGDAVNLSSRLEGLTKNYGVFCLVGNETRRLAEPKYRFRELDLVQVKGKAEPVAIYELLGGPAAEIARYAAPELWAAGIAAYRAGRFSQARQAFTEFQASNSQDRAVSLYLERLAELGETVPDSWRGVWVYKTK
jgi:adenylate cyclase